MRTLRLACCFLGLATIPGVLRAQNRDVQPAGRYTKKKQAIEDAD